MFGPKVFRPEKPSEKGDTYTPNEEVKSSSSTHIHQWKVVDLISSKVENCAICGINREECEKESAKAEEDDSWRLF